MSTDLKYLALVVAFTGLLWVPYVLERIFVGGLMDAVGYPTNPKPQSAWAQRLKRAHANAVENLVVFAPLVLIVHALGISNATTAGACVVYLGSRVVHALCFAVGIPWLRTLAFVTGFACQVALALQILGH